MPLAHSTRWCGSPVRSKRRVRHTHVAAAAAAATATIGQKLEASGLSASEGMTSPLLENTVTPNHSTASPMGGKVRIIASQKKKMRTSGGTFRINSTYSAAPRRTIQLRDKRAAPVATPSIVASTMPTPATAAVFRIPT